MGGSIGKIFAIMLAVLLLFIFPLLAYSIHIDNVTQTTVYNETVEFVDTIRNVGYISKDNFTLFEKRLGATGNQYDIIIKYYEKEVMPLLDEEGNATGHFEVGYNVMTTDEIYDKLYSSPQGRFAMKSGDYVTVGVSNSNRTLATKLQGLVLGRGAQKGKIFAQYGGNIK